MLLVFIRFLNTRYDGVNVNMFFVMFMPYYTRQDGVNGKVVASICALCVFWRLMFSYVLLMGPNFRMNIVSQVSCSRTQINPNFLMTIEPSI